MRYRSFTFTKLDLHLKKSHGHAIPRDMTLLLSYEVVLLPDTPARHDVYISGDGPFEVWQLTRIGEEQISGRLFCADMDGGVALARSELAEFLYRCRLPSERPRTVVAEGLITEAVWDVAKIVWDQASGHNSSATVCREMRSQSPIVTEALDLGFAVKTTGFRIGQFQTTCPGTNHALFITSPTNRWFCPRCRRNGGPTELRAFAKERETASVVCPDVL